MSLFELDVEIGDLPAVLTPRAEAIIEQWTGEVLDSYATQGLSEVRFWMDRFFRDPTPYYETQVTWDVAGRDRVIHDRGVIYGPWLAGTGSRNARSRFKGYTHWRRTVEYLRNDEGPLIVERHLPDLVNRLEA